MRKILSFNSLIHHSIETQFTKIFDTIGVIPAFESIQNYQLLSDKNILLSQLNDQNHPSHST